MAGVAASERADLERQLAALERQEELISLENEILLDHLQSQPDSAGADGRALDGTGTAGGSANRLGRGAAAGTSTTQRQHLTLEEKFAIASSQVDAFAAEMEKSRATHDQNIDILRALIQETDTRIAEVKREAYQFRRDIVVGGENPRTGQTMAERLLKYVEDQLTRKDLLVNKLLMKNAVFKQAIRKAMKQLRGKQESGDSLQYVDFHSLQIENQQFVVRIEETGNELLALKVTCTRVGSILDRLQEKLHRLAKESDFLHDELADRKKQLVNKEKEVTSVSTEKEQLQSRLRTQGRMSGDLPNVNKYVELKNESQLLAKELRVWKRKLSLAMLAAKDKGWNGRFGDDENISLDDIK